MNGNVRLPVHVSLSEAEMENILIAVCARHQHIASTLPQTRWPAIWANLQRKLEVSLRTHQTMLHQRKLESQKRAKAERLIKKVEQNSLTI